MPQQRYYWHIVITNGVESTVFHRAFLSRKEAREEASRLKRDGYTVQVKQGMKRTERKA